MKRAPIRLLQVLLPVGIVAVAGGVAATMIANRPPVGTVAPETAPPGVRVHEAVLRSEPLRVTSQGTVQPRTESQLVPQVAGRVTWVAPAFAAGGFFESGDVLVRIDRFDYEQMLVSARSQLAQARFRLAQEEAEAEVARREWDALGRGAPRELALRQPQLEEARAAVAAAEAGVERAERDLERTEIMAPYSGRVRTTNVDIGDGSRQGRDGRGGLPRLPEEGSVDQIEPVLKRGRRVMNFRLIAEQWDRIGRFYAALPAGYAPGVGRPGSGSTASRRRTASTPPTGNSAGR